MRETRTRVAMIVWSKDDSPEWIANDGPFVIWRDNPAPYEFELWDGYCLTELLR